MKKALFAGALLAFIAWQLPSPHHSITGKTATQVKKPLFKDFMGINGNFTFKPELYNQVCRLVRNYHDMNRDVKQPGDTIRLPECVNHTNWKRDVYGPWKKAGFETDICIQFSSFGGGAPGYKQYWDSNSKMQWSYDYGKAMASYFGPSGREKLCTSFEIDNEPGIRFDPALFRQIFKKMATGIRDGDPKAKILTPAVHARKGDDYAQDLNSYYAEKDILPLYDVINLHTYPMIEHSATSENSWNRSFPEDTSIAYLKVVDEAIAWRNKNAADKDIWITEFGYDACTPEAMKHRSGWALKLNWQGATDLQQAQYLVRSFMVFAERDIQRAYIFYYDDNDEASVHAASGLTRKFRPKMSFWAVKQLYETLGDYRFRRIVKKEPGSLYVYEFEHDKDPNQVVWVAWSPTGARTNEKEGYKSHEVQVTLNNLPGTPVAVTGMATSAGKAPGLSWKKAGPAAITLTVSESPAYIMMNR